MLTRLHQTFSLEALTSLPSVVSRRDSDSHRCSCHLSNWLMFMGSGGSVRNMYEYLHSDTDKTVVKSDVYNYSQKFSKSSLRQKPAEDTLPSCFMPAYGTVAETRSEVDRTVGDDAIVVVSDDDVEPADSGGDPGCDEHYKLALAACMELANTVATFDTSEYLARISDIRRLAEIWAAGGVARIVQVSPSTVSASQDGHHTDPSIESFPLSTISAAVPSNDVSRKMVSTGGMGHDTDTSTESLALPGSMSSAVLLSSKVSPNTVSASAVVYHTDTSVESFPLIRGTPPAVLSNMVTSDMVSTSGTGRYTDPSSAVSCGTPSTIISAVPSDSVSPNMVSANGMGHCSDTPFAIVSAAPPNKDCLNLDSAGAVGHCTDLSMAVSSGVSSTIIKVVSSNTNRDESAGAVLYVDGN